MQKTLLASAALSALLATAAHSETIVLVHGAFMDGAAWSDVAPKLEAAGNKVIIVTLPGRNASGDAAKAVSLDNYRDTVLAAIKDEAAPVVLVGHSFGGFAISAAAEAQPEKVRRLVYLGAYIPANGESLDALSKTDKGTKFSQTNFVLGADYSYAEVLKADRAMIFAQDGTSQQQEKVSGMLLREPLAPLGTPITVSAKFAAVSKSAIVTLQDQALGPALQRSMIARAGITAVSELATGHSPFVTKPDETAAAILAALK
jgi:pimeloyl-ACP methyl ester carboxylesterase